MSGFLTAASLALATGLLLAATGPARAGDADAGARVFVQCKVCHQLAPGRHGVGPSLYGVIGRKAGTAPGFSYSTAVTNAGFVWDEARLAQWLSAPAKYLPGTKMPFAGLKNPTDIEDVIAYLRANGGVSR